MGRFKCISCDIIFNYFFKPGDLRSQAPCPGCGYKHNTIQLRKGNGIDPLVAKTRKQKGRV